MSIRVNFIVCLWLCIVGVTGPGLAIAESTPPPPPTVRGDADVRPAPKRRIDLQPAARMDERPKAQPAQANPIDADQKNPTTPPIAPPSTTTAKPKFRKYGIEIRGAALFLPEFFLTGLFFSEAEGVINGGFGIGFVLKTDPTFEFVFGIGYHFFNFIDSKDSAGNPIPHVFNNKDEGSFQREFVFNSLSYLTIDVRFLKTFPIHPRFHFLIGIGLGMGIIFGKIVRTDTYIPGYDPRKEQEYTDAYERWRQDKKNPNNALPNKVCETVSDGQDCKLNQTLSEDKDIKEHSKTGNPQGRKEDRTPPVIPIFDFVMGFVFPVVIDRWDIRIQGGVGVPRLFWVGMSTHIYF